MAPPIYLDQNLVIDGRERDLNRSLAPSERSLRRLDQWSKWTLIVTLFLLPVVLYFASGIKIGSASAHAWLPEGRAERQRYEEFVRAFGNDQFLVVSWDGCRVDDPRLMSFQSLVANAQDQSPLWSRESSRRRTPWSF